VVTGVHNILPTELTLFSFLFVAAVGRFHGQIPKGPTIIVLWVKDPNHNNEVQAELLEEASNLVTSVFESRKSILFEISEGVLVYYHKLDLRLANRTIHKHLSKLG
jgi:hypothetical protein